MSKSEWRKKLTGISVSLPTFNNNSYDLELNKTKKHISWLIQQGLNAENSVFFIAGGLGEGYFLDDYEWEAMANALVEAAEGRIPTGIGVFELSARTAAKKAAYATKLGMDFIQCAPPRYMQPTEDEIYEHYKYINDHSEIGIMAYNTPWRMPGGYNFSAKLIERFMDIENFVALKWSTTSVQHYMNMIRLFSKDINFISNGSIMSIGYKLGATGFTDFLVNVAPRLSLHKFQLIKENRYEEFDELELKLNIDPPLRYAKTEDLVVGGMGEGPGARLRLESLGMNTGPHFPSQVAFTEEYINAYKQTVKDSDIIEWVDWEDKNFNQQD